MRKYLLLTTTLLLGACGGGSGAGPDVVSAPPPVVGGKEGSFVDPTEAKTYKAIGGTHTFQYRVEDRSDNNGQTGQLYQGNASTVRDSDISISYDPRDAIYTLKVVDALSGASFDGRFQDPAHRVDFGGANEPQFGNARFQNPNVQFLESGTGDASKGGAETPPVGQTDESLDITTMFMLKPGSETQYVTYAGFVSNQISWSEDSATNAAGEEVNFDVVDFTLQRGAFAYGELTNTAAVPKTGSASYQGSMIASMIFNPTLDGQSQVGSDIYPSYFQWVEGSANLAVNFAAGTIGLDLSGRAFATQDDGVSGFTGEGVLAQGATFSATGAGTINLANFGGFRGEFSQAGFVNPDGSRYDVNIAGSSLDGAFYGPAAEEVGGGFRIVGGTPDERIDILGAFIGK
ncbi:transferrin-binding protein-like solute binding protein [Novosphingobium aquimarinum]|uniref:transferrin-binding protein-like solute binding protein n=1 Tax=Novosphingobium aquimarinum TaxID=2682494 RepID=UPI0012EC0C64|nr:transferrin-binding protein-like solute binding protein [Novosphingobium aquimarinum]